MTLRWLLMVYARYLNQSFVRRPQSVRRSLVPRRYHLYVCRTDHQPLVGVYLIDLDDDGLYPARDGDVYQKERGP